MLPKPVITRLSRFRRVLTRQWPREREYIFSHELAAFAKATAAQVRRDLMTLNVVGSPSKGYRVRDLLDAISAILDNPQGHQLALIGVGNLGRALLAHFPNRNPNLKVVAAFDVEPTRINRVTHGCPVHSLDELETVIRDKNIQIAILAMPATAAQEIVNRLVRTGIRGLVNYTLARLDVPHEVHVENLDMTAYIERAAYFATNSGRNQ